MEFTVGQIVTWIGEDRTVEYGDTFKILEVREGVIKVHRIKDKKNFFMTGDHLRVKLSLLNFL